MKNFESHLERLEHLAALLGRRVLADLYTCKKHQRASLYVEAFNILVGGRMFDGRCARRAAARVEELIREHERNLDVQVAPPKKRHRYPKYMRPYLRRLRKEKPQEYEQQIERLLNTYTEESVLFDDDRRNLSMDRR